MKDLPTTVTIFENYLEQQKLLLDEESVGMALGAIVRDAAASTPGEDAGRRGRPDTSGPESAEPESLRDFARRLQNCTKCPLSRGRTRVVFGAGNEQAAVMLIGEGPGREEDLQGLPFVGAAGQILDRMLGKMGFAREEVYIANVVKCRPPENRNPAPDEIAVCSPFLMKQIAMISPNYLICLGNFAARLLTGRDEAVGKLRGRVHQYEGKKVFITYHPAALLRNQKLFWEVFKDMQLFRQVYDKEIGDKPPMA